MKAFPRTLFFAIGVFIATSFAAGQAKDALAGSWKLNLAKSTFVGPPPMAGTRVFEDLGAGFIYVKNDGFGEGVGDNRIVFKRDGKDYPVESLGQKAYVTIAFTVKSKKPFTADYVAKADGKVTATATESLSPDGKTYTAITKGTNPQGQPFTVTWVMDKQ